ncbi:ceramide synthase 5 isoform X1 [Excalfactoria chinensis]|uniref:ceramide synthase 5 isoform X1 n=1 Tax=Excalfactoria chinensis TaxID=46218 RepID=UPI003B3A7C05
MAAAAVAAIRAWFWNERFWLPHNVTWADLAGEPDGGLQYPRASHVLSAFPLALGIFAVRLLFERFIAKPCAINLGIQDSGAHRAQPNAILEKVFTSITKSPDGKRLEGLSKQLDWDVRKIQRWFRHRRNQDKPTTITKFCESMWRFTFYLSIFLYGIRFLWTAPWFWDTRQCWYSYPFQPLTSRLYYYYILELAFYWSLMFSQFTDIKRKDFLIMFVHHLATIGLITFSYMNNMVRVGTLVLCLHDASDFLLEAAKLANYAKYQRLCDAFFMLFGVVFIVTRLGIYPFWILNTTLFESWELIGPYPSWWLFNGLLVTLQILHVIWSYLIVRTAYKALVRGKVLQRSEQCPVTHSGIFACMICWFTKTLMSVSVVLVNTLLSERGQQKSNPFCEKDYSGYGKNIERSLLSDPWNFQYRRRVRKGTRSFGYKSKYIQQAHQNPSWRSLTLSGFLPHLPWS